MTPLDQVLEIVRAQVAGAADTSLDATTQAADLRGWDSVAMVNVLFEMEERFGVEFTSRQMERADGVPSLLQILAEARGR